MNDALGNPIQLGKNYGYSQSNNGTVSIVIGRVESMDEDTRKVSIGNTHERSGSNGIIKRDFAKCRKRSVYGCSIFPIETLADRRNSLIDEILNDETE